MRGVDRGDQLIGNYNVGRRSTKWWKRCFSHLIECSLLNAYILDSLTEHAQAKRDFLTFRLDVAQKLIKTFSSRKAAGRSSGGKYTQVERLNPQLGHWPTSSKRKLECAVCSTKWAKLHLSRSELRHESRIKCSRCNVHLCIEGRQCYKKYHTNLQYWQ